MLRFVFDCETNGLLHELDTVHSLVLRDIDSGDVEYITPDKTENINKVFCLRDISTMKVLYTSLREKNLIDEMDIVDIQELYGKG